MKNQFAMKNIAAKILWIFSSDQLDQEAPEQSGKSNFGEKGFVSWLFGSETLTEEPLVDPSPSPFGSKGFIRWLSGSDGLEEEDE